MNDKINVCLLNDSFPPAIDGVANTTFNYASIIQKQYGTATVATPYYPNVTDNYPFEVLRYKSFDTTDFIGYRAGMPLKLKFLSQFTDKNIDIIHSHCPVSSTFLARILREQEKKPIIMTYHTKFDYDIRKAVNNKLIQDMAIKALVYNISCVDEVWAVSKGAGENLKSLGYKGDYIVMPNGVDFSKGKAPQTDIDYVRNKYSIAPGKPVYLFVGRMMWYKGLKIILDALRIVKSHDLPFTMLFVGAGADKEDVMEYANTIGVGDNCIFTGAIIDRRLLKAIFSIADLFLFPSVYDTNGIVVREAAASGLGSILIEGSCAAEDTDPNVNCIWIKENAEAMAEVLVNNGNNMDYFHQIGKNAEEQLYMSWEESVALAVERYKVVSEKFEYKKTVFNKDLMDNYFSILSALSISVSKSRKAKDRLVSNSEKFKDKMFTYVDEVKDNVKDGKEEIENHIQDFFDRYL